MEQPPAEPPNPAKPWANSATEHQTNQDAGHETNRATNQETNPEVGRGSGSLPADARNGLALFAAAFALLIVVGGLTQRLVYGLGRHHAELLGPLGIAVTELLAICVPALLFINVQLRKQRAAHPTADLDDALPFLPNFIRSKTMPLSRIALGVVGGTLAGAGFFYLLSVFIAPLIERLFPVPPEERAHLMRLLHPESGLRPLWQDVLCFAAVPALCEELLFRGALLTTLGARPWNESAQRKTTLRAVLLSGILFGIFHVSPSKIFPTALLGIGFGLSAVMGRSLWAAIAMHCMNNAMVIVLVRAGLEEVPQDARALIYSVCALAATVLGFAILHVAGGRKVRRSDENR